MPQTENDNLGCEDLAKSLFPNFPTPTEGPDDVVLKKQAKRKHIVHRKTFQIGVTAMAVDYYDAAKSYFETFRYNRHAGDPIKLFMNVVDFYSVEDGHTRTVRDFLGNRIDDSTTVSPDVSSVMRILAIWLSMPGLGTSTAVTIENEQHRECANQTTAGVLLPTTMAPATVPLAEVPLGDLINRCLPPRANWGGPGHFATNRKRLFTKSFNGAALRWVARLEFEWTRDITEHLLLKDQTLYLFRTAGFCYYANYCTALSKSGNDQQSRSPGEVKRYPAGSKFPELTQEVSRTFQLLFGSTPESSKILYDDLIKTDEKLQNYIVGRPDIGQIWTCDWKNSMKPRHNYFCEDFPYFGQRLMELEDILKEAQPTSLMQLFRDSRNTLQHWTFLTAIAVFVLALISMILQVIQAVAAWVQISKM